MFIVDNSGDGKSAWDITHYIDLIVLPLKDVVDLMIF